MSFIGMQLSPTPVRYYEGKPERKPDRATLILAHNSESPATLPFREALAKKLESEGIFVVEAQLHGTAERGWTIRDALPKRGAFPDRKKTEPEDETVNSVLLLADSLVRVRLIENVLSQKDAGLHCVLEIHASPNLLSAESICGFTRDGRMPRIPGTLMAFAELLPILEKELASYVEMILSPKMADFAGWAAKLIGFDIKELAEELPGRFEALGERSHAIFALEVPGKWMPLEESHPMHDYYFYPGLENACVKDASQLERMYSTNRLGSAGFTQNSVDAAAYLITPKKPVS